MANCARAWRGKGTMTGIFGNGYYSWDKLSLTLRKNRLVS